MEIFSSDTEKSKFPQAVQNLLRDDARALPFTSQFDWVMVARRVFRSQDGLVGLGPRSVVAGDRIFVLLDAREPFLLRPTSEADSSSTCYEMVCEAYIHGIMKGEALDRVKLKKTEVEIV